MLRLYGVNCRLFSGMFGLKGHAACAIIILADQREMISQSLPNIFGIGDAKNRKDREKESCK